MTDRHVSIDERRRAVRVPAAFPATVRNPRGVEILSGRTADFSERGALIVGRCDVALRRGDRLEVTLVLPDASKRSRQTGRREVHYRVRVAHAERIGHLSSIGVEFLRKLG